jgi:hypothetical protein
MTTAMDAPVTILLFALVVASFASHVVASDTNGPPALAVEEQVKGVGGEHHVEPDLLEIKFRDGQTIRLRDSIPRDINGKALTSPEAQDLLKNRLAGATWMRSQDLPEEEIDRLRLEAQQISGVPLPDLNLYFRLRLPPDVDANKAAVMLLHLPEVEAVYRVPRPPPYPLLPTTTPVPRYRTRGIRMLPSTASMVTSPRLFRAHEESKSRSATSNTTSILNTMTLAP